MSPAVSILSGGISVTVSGEDLNENVTYYLNFVNPSNPNATVTSGETKCQHVNGTNVTCTTPQVSLSPPSNVNPPSTSDSTAPLFTLDAVLTYEDGTRRYSITPGVSVYSDPVFKPFTENMTFIQGQGNVITIKSNKKLLGFSRDDVRVQVGIDNSKSMGLCDHVIVQDYQVTCQPPSIDPQIIQYGAEPDYTLPVKITVGNARSNDLGSLIYGLYQPFSVIIIVMVIILGLIVIISVIIGLLTVCGCECSCCSHSSELDKQHLTPEEYDDATVEARRPQEQGYDTLNTKSYRVKMSSTGRNKWSPEDSNVDTWQTGRISKRGEDNMGYSGPGTR